ncbi:MAG: PIN domain-containing protein [archaeon]
MREIFEKLPRLTLNDKVDFLIDTCFFAWIFENHKQKEFKSLLKEKVFALTSFNVEEFLFIHNDLHNDINIAARKFFHHTNKLFVLEVPVHPGDADKEHAFVKSVLPDLDTIEHDPSDAVILAAAIETGASILTRDKHDIFNSTLENFLEKHGVKAFNTFHKS